MVSFGSLGRRLVAAVALIGTTGAAHAEVLRIGIAQAGGGDPLTFGGTPLGVVRNQQLLEKAFAGTDTEVQWFFFKGAGPAVNEALSNRQIDFAYQGDLPQVVARANGLDTKLLVTLGTRSNIYVAVPKGSSIKSVADLKEKKVAIFRGTNGHLVAINVLAEQGLTERDLKVINLDTGSTQAALAAKGVDAAFGGLELFKLRDQGLVDIIYSTQGQDPKLTRQVALTVRGDYEKEHPEQTQKVVDVVIQAARWASEESNRRALLEEWAKSGAPLTSWEAEYAGQSLKDRNSPLVDPFVRGRYQAVADQAKQEKLIRRSVQLDGWFDTRYLEQALQRQSLQSFWVSYAADGRTQLPVAEAGSGSLQEVAQHESR